MSALYFSISKDHASSFPDTHSATSRVSLRAPRTFFFALMLTGVIGGYSRAHFGKRVVRRSIGHKARERLDGNCQSSSWRQLECRGTPKRSSALPRRESLGHGRKAS